MKIILWIDNNSNQKALANKLNEVFPISGLIIESRQSRIKLTFRLISEKMIEKIFIPSIGKVWRAMLEIYEDKYPSYPNTDILKVENINSELAFNFTSKHNPDLILVSGTRLVKEKMLNIKPSIGILNLHTGLSPYVKGGPNCTNWCIANKDFHLIGNTIMWIDAGIDSGNILTTECTSFDGKENLLGLHLKVMEHAHALCINAIRFLNSGKRQSVEQSEISIGATYFTKQWSLKQKIKLMRNFPLFKKDFDRGNITKKRKDIRTINL
jgi:folate-dependent phosphoribosylglycinamide formyltransferase PurN